MTARKESRRPHRWILHAGPTELAELRERRTRPPGWYTRLRWTDTEPPAPAQDEDQTDITCSNGPVASFNNMATPSRAPLLEHPDRGPRPNGSHPHLTKSDR